MTGSLGLGSTMDVRILPFTPCGLVCPSPVAYRLTNEPGAAPVWGRLMLPSWFRIAPWPAGVCCIKMAGEESAMRRMIELEMAPR